jgi:hypothetical protein
VKLATPVVAVQVADAGNPLVALNVAENRTRVEKLAQINAGAKPQARQVEATQQ